MELDNINHCIASFHHQPLFYFVTDLKPWDLPHQVKVKCAFFHSKIQGLGDEIQIDTDRDLEPLTTIARKTLRKICRPTLSENGSPYVQEHPAKNFCAGGVLPISTLNVGPGQPEHRRNHNPTPNPNPSGFFALALSPYIFPFLLFGCLFCYFSLFHFYFLHFILFSCVSSSFLFPAFSVSGYVAGGACVLCLS